MSRPRARPKFRSHHPATPEEILAHVRTRMDAARDQVIGRLYRRTVFLTTAPPRAHFWSPHLEVQLTDAPGGGTHVQGQFGPHQAIWTTFVIIQLIFGVLSLGAAMFLFSKWMLGQDLVPWLIVLAAMLFGGGFSYGAAYVGQGLGSDEMYELRALVDDALRAADPAGTADTATPAAAEG